MILNIKANKIAKQTTQNKIKMSFAIYHINWMTSILTCYTSLMYNGF